MFFHRPLEFLPKKSPRGSALEQTVNAVKLMWQVYEGSTFKNMNISDSYLTITNLYMCMFIVQSCYSF